MDNFADRLLTRFENTKSVLTAGLDPSIDALPKFIRDQVLADSVSDEDYIYKVLTRSFIPALEALANSVSACKPNIAFFEQYGIGGLRAFADILLAARALDIPVIADAKRGDIGSTAEAYANAFLGGSKVKGQSFPAFESDALTVNPYLGADTLEVFVTACERHAKGLFVLVRTSNPGSQWLQGLSSDQETVSKRVASWINERGQSLRGQKGVSALGAVVGATYPAEAKELRSIMKDNLFLIPGFGAQGGAASDAVAGFAENSISAGASTVNVSRGLFSVFSQDLHSVDELQQSLLTKAAQLNLELNSVLSA